MNELAQLYTVIDQYQLFNISPTYPIFLIKSPKSALTLGHLDDSFFILPLQNLSFHRCCSLSPGGQASELMFYFKSIFL